MRTLTFTAVLTAAAATLVGCGNLSYGAHQEDRTYSAPAGVTALKIRSGGSRVEITGSDSPGIKVRERLTWSNDKNKPEPRHVAEGGTLALTSKCAKVVVGLSGTGCGVSYRIEVPRGTPVEVDNDDGRIVASGLGGTVKLHTDNGALKVTDLRATSVTLSSDDGSIEVSGHAGTAHLQSDNGRITATGLTADRLTARTSDGHISVAGRVPVADLRTSNGGIDARGLTTDRISAKTSDGPIDLRFAAAPTEVRATSGNGPVHVRVPRGDGYAITLTSGNGPERIDPAVHQDSRSTRTIQLRSGDGPLTVSPA
ncbi:DUF4097 family beta strand repeat-containing protein [Actinomadura decatromicini]|uniref:DUF4097 domain-containing protein n=1 Tax=Actinomadura decatromicini TaxID=2604572 RepID=A0A5D3FY32_9ACTN|nr:DUF4097 family beta strand repeat-containing protein [Actinomadura decatromicini]TYK52988.1 DUF4097 domain-containing protein [Actinomadura decatromicini]